jgi:UrcA family protein
MQILKHKLLAGLAIGALVSLPALAAAPGADNEFTVRVHYKDLDIQSAPGARALYDRLQHASAQACNLGSYRELGSLERVRDAHVCYKDVLDSLVSKIDSPELHRLHDS